MGTLGFFDRISLLVFVTAKYVKVSDYDVVKFSVFGSALNESSVEKFHLPHRIFNKTYHRLSLPSDIVSYINLAAAW